MSTSPDDETDAGPQHGAASRAALGPDEVPFGGFELSVIVDRAVYAPGDVVRITVTAVNQGGRFVEHHYPGWSRFDLHVLDEYHRPVADTEVDRVARTPAVDRWLPGQMVLFPLYWGQHEGPIVPTWSDTATLGARVEAGRYRARVRWHGREPASRAEPADAFSPFFELR